MLEYGGWIGLGGRGFCFISKGMPWPMTPTAHPPTHGPHITRNQNTKHSLRPLVTALCTEAAAVANAACFPHTSPSIPPPLPSPNEGDGNGPAAPVAHPQTRGQGPALSLSFDPAEMEAYVLQVAAQTAGNESSMLRDVVQGRKTEVNIYICVCTCTCICVCVSVYMCEND